MTYCTNTDCPFDDCKSHPNKLTGQTGERWFANMGNVCKRYIEYVFDEVTKGDTR